MGLKEILEQNPQLTLNALQQFQREYDKRFVDDEFTGFNKIRHTYAHMGKLMGRLAEYIQMVEDNQAPNPNEIKEKVIPDLLVYASWLAREFDVKLEEAYITRIAGNIQRLHKDKISSEEYSKLIEQLDERFHRVEKH